ncbi:L,D-transpeptidase family protein [Fictibacillus nanhaiensis]|uniref:L,D-transpeptidase n=1 Tax=Fictibacillus nanhaiensis TaxID=742169 RepID=UPI001C942CF5|nr:L,D-transpeptidase [Fictibacillus nanhaiensis]MBY6037201.1 L,D-transpeptidase family protein [Fictibacillus nanhaiensis]
MDYLKKDLIEGRPNMYIRKDDPEFYKKFLRCQPNHKEALYEYAKELYGQGKFVDAIKKLEKAKSLGYYKADSLLKEWNGLSSNLSKIEKRSEHGLKRTFLWTFLITSVLCLLLLFLPLLINNYWVKENNYYYSENNHIVSAQAKTDPSELPSLIFLNGAERYKEKNGKYPTSEHDLLKRNGQLNTLSYIPKEHYIFSSSPLQISSAGKVFERNIPKDFTVELHFFQNVNKLALVRGSGEVLSIYPVASGKEKLPFNKSIITERVVNPNGGDGAFGTRGLVLEDNYAIHGTDNPFSIGSRSTKGCIRLFNDHIEELYPYIALGTPFSVKEGEPPAATFQEGLPMIALTQQQLASETQSNQKFHWNH